MGVILNNSKSGSKKAVAGSAKKAKPKTEKTMSYLKKGKSASTEVTKATAQAEERKAGNFWRFWLKEDTEAKITFLDGDLLEDGTIDGVVFHEHNVKLNGNYGNFYICINEFEACPLCEQGDNPAFCAAFTIIDHRTYKDREGKEHKNQTRLFVCKLDTYKMLQKIATKRGGLAGASFDVSRTGDKSSNVGNMFDFIIKKPVATVFKKYDTEVIDYEEAMPYKDGKTMRALGFGLDTSGGYNIDDDDDDADDAGADYDDEL